MWSEEEERLKVYRDWQNVLRTNAQKNLEKGIAIATQNIARNMKAKGFSDEQIQQATDLSPEEISRL